MKSAVIARMFCPLALALSTLPSAGCEAGSGFGSRKITFAQIPYHIKRGTSTKTDMRALLGDPPIVTPLGGGEEMWTYYYLKVRLKQWFAPDEFPMPTFMVPFLVSEKYRVSRVRMVFNLLSIRFRHDGVVETFYQTEQGDPFAPPPFGARLRSENRQVPRASLGDDSDRPGSAAVGG